MNLLKKLTLTALFAGITTVFVSCVGGPGSHRPIPGTDDIPLTEETKTAIDRKDGKLKIAVIPEKAEYTNEYVTKYGINKVVGDKVESLCDGLSMFEIVPRTEMEALISESTISKLVSGEGDIALPESVDHLLIYNITACNIDARQFSEYEMRGDKSYEVKVKRFGGFITLKLTLINTKTNKKLFTKTIEGKTETSNYADSEGPELLTSVIDSALNKFIKEFAFDFSPVGYVMQTTGGGRWAKISLGSGDGLSFHTRVEFFKKDVNGQSLPFAYGEVREVNYDYSWVYVDDHKNAGVRNNATVKVTANQDRTLWDQFCGAFIYPN